MNRILKLQTLSGGDSHRERKKVLAVIISRKEQNKTRKVVLPVTIEIGILLTITGLICTMFGLLTGFFTFRMNRDKEVKKEASSGAVIETKLDNIYRLVDGMILDLKNNDRRWNEISLFVARLDEKLHQADRQIETIRMKQKEDEL